MGLFSLIKSLRKSSLNILILGLDNSGKTTLLTTLTNGNINTITPTSGFTLKTTVIDGHKLTLWDLAGQTTLRPHWRNYYATADVLIFVIDSSDLRRLQECGRELRGVLDSCRVPLLVLANKQDLVNALDGDEVHSKIGFTIQIAKGLNLDSIRDRNWQIQACSGKTGKGIKEGMDWAMRQAECA